MRLTFKHSQKGAALIIVIFFFIMISLAVIQSATIGAVVELRAYRTLAGSKFAYVASEAGVEDIFYRTINKLQIPSTETIALNGATSTVTVVTTSATQKDIYTVGQVNSQIRKVYISISNNKNVSFPYGAQVGEGGITMGNNATIDGTALATGNVYSDGQIVGGLGVTITGNAVSSSGLSTDQYASSTQCDTYETVGKTNPNIDYAQSFVMSTTSAQLYKVSLNLGRNGNAIGANVQITADVAGRPSTVPLATQALPYSSVSPAGGWVDVILTSPPTLNLGSTYWIVLDTTQSSVKYWTWCRSNTDTYVTGTPYFKTDWTTAGAWTSVTGDMTFKLTFGGGISKISNVSVSGVAKADSITSSTIGGNAYYQSISGSTVGGASNPGSPTPPYVPLPISSSTILAWEGDAAGGGTIIGNCGVAGVPACNTFPLTLGPKEITGDLIVGLGNTLTVSGTLYVHGNIDVQNNASLSCDFGYQARSCIIIADGYIHLSNNDTFSGSGIAGSYIMLLSTKKGCIGTPSSGCTTNNSAIEISNNVNGAIFYTTDSLIDISNNATVTAVVGYMIQLANNANIHYDPAALNVLFAASAVPTTGGWNSNRWNEY